ncbi:MAG: hypothetical protein AAB445_01835 [Patescibacteria group bacterium]
MQKQFFFITTILTGIASFFISGFIGVIFQFTVGFVLVKLFFGKGLWNSVKPKAKTSIILVVLLVGLCAQFVGIRLLAALVQNSSMGQ